MSQSRMSHSRRKRRRRWMSQSSMKTKKRAVAGSSGRGAMPFEQKRKLSVALGMLPPEKLVQVVEIVKRRATISGADDGNDEIELDMETLDSETLWELDDYVNQCKKKKVPPRTPWRPVALPRPRPRR